MSTRNGFTLIELLIVVVIIGILATIAIPKFANTKEKAYTTSMKSDLRNLITAEESYFVDYTTYTTAVTDYETSAGVTVSIGSATVDGWIATASHTGTSFTCTVAIGSAAGTANEGEPMCA